MASAHIKVMILLFNTLPDINLAARIEHSQIFWDEKLIFFSHLSVENELEELKYLIDRYSVGRLLSL